MTKEELQKKVCLSKFISWNKKDFPEVDAYIDLESRCLRYRLFIEEGYCRKMDLNLFWFPYIGGGL